MKKAQNGQVYAQAMLELARENKIVDDVLADFDLMATLLEEEENFRLFLELPFFKEDDKQALLDKVLKPKVSETFLLFAKNLIYKHRFPLFAKIHSIYRELADLEAKRVRATATTAYSLKNQEIEGVQSFLKDFLKKQTVVVTNEVSSEIIGGVVIQVGDLWIDASLKRKLDKLQESLINMSLPKLI